MTATTKGDLARDWLAQVPADGIPFDGTTVLTHDAARNAVEQFLKTPAASELADAASVRHFSNWTNGWASIGGSRGSP